MATDVSNSQKAPSLNDYEAPHRQAAALLARCVNAAVKKIAEQRVLKRLQVKPLGAITPAQAEMECVVNQQLIHAA
jgi:hypothetical protein